MDGDFNLRDDNLEHHDLDADDSEEEEDDDGDDAAADDDDDGSDYDDDDDDDDDDDSVPEDGPNRPEYWFGKEVVIEGFNGWRVEESGGIVTTRTSKQRSHFVIERISGNKVAFRRAGTDLYLTQTLSGEGARNGVRSLLSRVSGLSLEAIPKIVEYAIAGITAGDNSEGAGYNYIPMTAQPGPPNILQIFELVPADGYWKFGMRSLFGTYWRSEHWNQVVSQSPNFLGDEMWRLSEISVTQRPDHWFGEEVVIAGLYGWRVEERGGIVTTGTSKQRSHFVIERISGNKVAFRRAGTDLYLTQTLYGEGARSGVRSLLSRVGGLLPELAPNIVEYVVTTSVDEGFNYVPMTVQPGPPDILQTFELIPAGDCDFGMRSSFKTYWRSEHWNHVVSQAPHLMGDETWRLEKAGLPP